MLTPPQTACCRTATTTRGGLFAGTDELEDEKGQRDAPGAPAGTGQENGCGHGTPLRIGIERRKQKKARRRSQALREASGASRTPGRRLANI